MKYSLISYGYADPPKPQIIPFYNILWAELDKNDLIIDFALPLNENVVPSTLKFSIGPDSHSVANWISVLLDCSYRGAQQKKRAKVLVNPYSGSGNARRWYPKYILPLFRAARCSIDSVETRYSGEGVAIFETLDIDAFDMAVVCSGDGLAHEVFNGLGNRPDAKKALSEMAVAHIPCGSGNGLSHNLNATGNASMATLAVIKGIRKPLDLISVTQGDTRVLSFLSQTAGMGAESDLATENLRWMGEARFKLGFLTRILAKKVYPCEIAVKIAIDDKGSIMDHYAKEKLKNSLKDKQCQIFPEVGSTGEDQDSGGLPPLKYGTIHDKIPEDWTVIPCENLGILYCGNLAYMAADAKFFPPALPNDGLMDLVLIDGNISRRASLKMFDALRDEKFFEMPVVKYYKISAYRWIPHNQESGYISVDGERIPFSPYQAEVHKGLGTVIMKNHKIAGAGPSP
ncbi:sphingoid long chain base kinase-like protein [Leptodontidium sp. MPI-SDFR-AT-0119]|nr:sphingoid long chain base kinase-like protein [Leptodontidium sp. MPI-SDFR-AT-0119]